MSLAPTAANLAWAATNLPAWAAFRRALANPRITQQTVLAKIIHSARRSEFGRRHGFDGIRAAADFAERVPIRDYSDFEPWIDRIRNGEPNILTADPVKRLAVTAGTSSARKLIPYTKGLQAEFNRAIGPWIVDLFRSHPKTIGGAAYWSISPVAQHDTEPPKVPIGFEEDSEYLGGIRRHLVDAVMAVPSSVRHASTIEEWRSETIRHLSSRRDLRLISIWHPSFLELLLDHLPASPSELWPNLSLVSCWGDGHSSLAMRALQDRLDPVAFQPKGLIATEGIVSIPFAGRWPLAVRSHYLEFLATDGSVVAAHELREGQTYEMLITTSGGLYRYRLNDLIRVEGKIAATPSIRFLGKTGHICDLRGEKLSEAFVGQVLQRLVGQYDLRWRFAMLAPDECRYTLFVEGDVPDGFAERLDIALRSNNQYAYCRDLGQLDEPNVFHIARDAWPIYVRRLVSLDQRLGDIKPISLSPLTGWRDVFSPNVQPSSFS